jgi:hypothetical protein
MAKAGGFILGLANGQDLAPCRPSEEEMAVVHWLDSAEKQVRN